MKAVVISRPGGPEVLRLVEVAEPEPEADEILVRVHATALNRADILQRMGRYPPPSGAPADIPGLEFAGTVEKTGASVTLWQVGDKVMGLLAGGGYSEKIVVHEKMAMPVAEHISFEQAAAIPEVFLTAFDALFPQLHLASGERLLIHAVGSGVGTAALQMAKQAGAQVFGTAGSDEKLGRARELGLDAGINYKRQDFAEIVRQHTNGAGVDAILDTIGALYWQKNIACLKTKGRMILVGLLGGRTVTADLGTILGKRLRIFGTVLRSRPLAEKIELTAKFRETVLPLLSAGKVWPVVDRVFPLQEAAAAQQFMEANQNFGKIVLSVQELQTSKAKK